MKNNLGLSNVLGQLVFNACLATKDCTADPTSGLNRNYRNISVESRIFSVANGADPLTAPTNGQLFSGIPWYNFVSEAASRAGLDKVFITGIRNTDQYHTNLGFVNASQFSSTDDHGDTLQRHAARSSRRTVSRCSRSELHSAVGSPNLFPSFTKAATSTGAYVVVQQSGTTADPGRGRRRLRERLPGLLRLWIAARQSDPGRDHAGAAVPPAADERSNHLHLQ